MVNPFYQRIIWWNWLKLAKGIRRRRLWRLSMCFCFFRYFLPLEKCIVLYLSKREFPSPKRFVSSWVILAQWFSKFFKNTFSLFRNYRQLEKDVILHLITLESSLSRDDLWQVWLNVTKGFWRRFQKFVNIFLLFHIFFPYWCGLSFEQT